MYIARDEGIYDEDYNYVKPPANYKYFMTLHYHIVTALQKLVSTVKLVWWQKSPHICTRIFKRANVTL